ncbi:uncharacterized protein Z518_00240 [Rhinocladiella mackenziei CBS 650.93]|uniref:Rhinocladiella mackenziei CBS 650.93 unplaced genomic scaffold supercont1.1, whole genome shotgun sequence n=1 Tax=Rhinocladiella mackenziei CBS 650.93 TaxID=1442369 RepID=A0A0D2G3J6_9EURO|nr:uncharacterized protein Z518_00240 [Rhinocladiella mackenziei CBS 650.93]KIX09162.1 hypothetical protein Z518_00240 [Rhinocladiella mackenziei CBS 650.93]
MFSVLNLQGQNDSSPSPEVPPHPRFKTSTGCWTCRARRIKCDKHKPRCQRCLNHSLHCQGYGLRLGWAKYTHNGKPEPEERLRNPVTASDHGPALDNVSPVDITAMLDTLEKCTDEDISKSMGPFSVFRVSSHLTPRSNVGSNPSQSQTDADAVDSDSSGIAHSWSSMACNISGRPPSDNSITGTGRAESTISRRPSSPMWESPQRFSISDESPTTDASKGHYHQSKSDMTSKSWKQTHGSSRTVRHMDMLVLPAWHRELIHHWVTFLAENLIPLDTALNPLRKILLPMALQGILSNSGRPNGSTALFHSMSAVASYSLLELKGSHGRYQQLALQHEQLFFHYLREALSLTDHLKDEGIPLAILVYNTKFSISGHPVEWRQHVLGGIRWLINTGFCNQDILQKTRPVVCSLYLYGAIMGNLDLPADVMETLTAINADDDGFDYIFGMNQSMLCNLSQIHEFRLAQRAPDPQDLQTLEMRLYMQVPGPPQRDCAETKEAKLIRHLGDVYYCAALIYFQRGVLGFPPHTIQYFVRKGLDSLEAMETLTNGTCGCISVWFSIIIGAECESPALRESMLSWFRRKRRHGLKIVDVASTIVKTAWQMRTLPGKEKFYWQDMSLEPEYDVLLW